ncbi:MAG TPA: adenylate/guanylate cyclase domain-containing protein [Chloroflexota bacterium]|nr:adenylate/guanylate cyclase domain-containing protein [Chloroflexota bacterium]
MKVSKAALKRGGLGLGIVALVNLLVLGLLFAKALSGPQTWVTDQMMVRAANRTLLGNIIIAAIDDKSQAAYGRLDSWDRAHYAELITRMYLAGAADVVFDLPLQGSEPHDNLVAAAIENAMHPKKGDAMWVVLGVPPSGNPTYVAGKGLVYRSFQQLSPLIAATDALRASVAMDASGSYVRRMPFVSFGGNQRLFSLPIQAVNAGYQNPPLEKTLKFKPGQVDFGVFKIPVDQYNRMTMDYFSTPGHFLTFSFVDLASGRVNPAVLKGSVILVGEHNGTGLADNFPVPTSISGAAKMDGVEIWANAVQDLLFGRFLGYQGTWPTFGLAVLFSAVAAAVFLRFGALGWLATLLIALVYTGIEGVITAGNFFRPPVLGAAHEQVITIPNVAYVDAALLLSSAALFVYLFIQEQRSRGQIYEMFGRYVTPAVAQQLAGMEASGHLQLGGTRREATIMFAELRGAHSSAEGSRPEDVLEMLNRYFEQAVRIIIDRGGTINKFIGEDVMVMFNVPLDLEGHALAACRAAFEAQEFVKRYREERGETAAFGIGINTGSLVAGNMGSQDRMEFTVIGDTVNVASRLNGVAKLDDIILSQATLDQLDGSGAQVIDRGDILVKGRQEPVHCYKLVGFAEQGPVQIVGKEDTVATPATTH